MLVSQQVVDQLVSDQVQIIRLPNSSASTFFSGQLKFILKSFQYLYAGLAGGGGGTGRTGYGPGGYGPGVGYGPGGGYAAVPGTGYGTGAGVI